MLTEQILERFLDRFTHRLGEHFARYLITGGRDWQDYGKVARITQERTGEGDTIIGDPNQPVEDVAMHVGKAIGAGMEEVRGRNLDQARPDVVMAIYGNTSQDQALRSFLEEALRRGIETWVWGRYGRSRRIMNPEDIHLGEERERGQRRQPGGRMPGQRAA